MDIYSHRLVPTRDHIVPKIAGGRATIVCCKFCNSLKGHMMPHEWDVFRCSFAEYWKFSPAERRAALAKHKREYVPGRAIMIHARKTVGPRGIVVVVPPELIYTSAKNA